MFMYLFLINYKHCNTHNDAQTSKGGGLLGFGEKVLEKIIHYV